MFAQAAPQQGDVSDTQGHPVAGASVSADGDKSSNARTDLEGRFILRDLPSGALLHVTAPGFAPQDVQATPGQTIHVALAPAPGAETVNVTAYRTALSAEESPVSSRTLTTEDLRQAPTSPALDDKLRQVPGFELFRRSSSLVANPTAQGVSLRGLGSTAASRTLVISDDVPLNDPFGGWIHWNELPELAIANATVVRGGVSDLYGSSAIGGVVDLAPVLPRGDAFEFTGSGGSFATGDVSALATAAHATAATGTWGVLATAGLLRTDGYTLIASQFRGPVDVPSNVHSENGRFEIDNSGTDTRRIFLRGNVLNEARDNGTPVTKNGTRLWRYESGAQWDQTPVGALSFRVFGNDENFRQTFSSIQPGRATEKLSRYVLVPAQELGASARWSRPLRHNLLLLAGGDVRDIRASDSEIAFLAPPRTRYTRITARQRQSGVYGEALWAPRAWTLTLSGRFDHFSNFDATQYLPTRLSEPRLSESVFDPRLGVVRHLTSSFSLTGSAFRAYRAPTLNELYRSGQVGQALTRPNSSLRSERATGFEAGVLYAPAGSSAALRASYFWTEVNRPITALTLSVTPTAITLQRQNLGQIRSRGVSLNGEIHPRPWLTAVAGYQYANATITQNAPQPALVGNWIPQVAHNTGTVNLRASDARLGSFAAEARWSGRQFDDDANLFLLHSFFALNLYADHTFHQRYTLFAVGENVLDRSIEAGRTPVLSLAQPRAARAGIRIRFGD